MPRSRYNTLDALELPWYKRLGRWIKNNPKKIFAGAVLVGLFVTAMVFAWPAILAGAGLAAICTAAGAGFGIPAAYALGVGAVALGMAPFVGLAYGLYGCVKLCKYAFKKREQRERASMNEPIIVSSDEAPKTKNSIDDPDTYQKLLKSKLKNKNAEASSDHSIKKEENDDAIIKSIKSAVRAFFKSRVIVHHSETKQATGEMTGRQFVVDKLLPLLEVNYKSETFCLGKIGKKDAEGAIDKILEGLYPHLIDFTTGFLHGLDNTMSAEDKKMHTINAVVQGVFSVVDECLKGDRENVEQFLSWLERKTKAFVTFEKIDQITQKMQASMVSNRAEYGSDDDALSPATSSRSSFSQC